MTVEKREPSDLERRWKDSPAGAAMRRDCPPPGSYLAAASGETSPSENRELADHAASCAFCSTTWNLARELAATDDARSRIPRGTDPARRATRWLGPLAAVAAALLLAALLVPWRPSSVRSESNVRDLVAESVASEVPDRAALPRERFVLRWTPESEGSTYDVRVLDLRLEHIAGARGLTSPSYEVPAEKLARLSAGDIVLWQVEVVLPDGRRRTSPTFTNLVE